MLFYSLATIKKGCVISIKMPIFFSFFNQKQSLFIFFKYKRFALIYFVNLLGCLHILCFSIGSPFD